MKFSVCLALALMLFSSLCFAVENSTACRLETPVDLPSQDLTKLSTTLKGVFYEEPSMGFRITLTPPVSTEKHTYNPIDALMITLDHPPAKIVDAEGSQMMNYFSSNYYIKYVVDNNYVNFDPKEKSYNTIYIRRENYQINLKFISNSLLVVVKENKLIGLEFRMPVEFKDDSKKISYCLKEAYLISQKPFPMTLPE